VQLTFRMASWPTRWSAWQNTADESIWLGKLISTTADHIEWISHQHNVFGNHLDEMVLMPFLLSVLNPCSSQPNIDNNDSIELCQSPAPTGHGLFHFPLLERTKDKGQRTTTTTTTTTMPLLAGFPDSKRQHIFSWTPSFHRIIAPVLVSVKYTCPQYNFAFFVLLLAALHRNPGRPNKYFSCVTHLFIILSCTFQPVMQHLAKFSMF
jgi:hypothetical protein